MIKNPWLLNKVLDDNSYWLKYVDDSYGTAHGLPVIQHSDLFDDFEETIFPYASLDGSSLPTDLALLKKLARRFEDCSYFEIGTWRGESVANVAAVAGTCHTLNLSAPQMRKMGMAREYVDLHRHFSSRLPNVTHLEGDSREFDFAALNHKFDLVFIDGDHHYELVRNDTEKVFRHLLHDRSIVVWHDYAFNPEKIRFEVLAGILDGCPEKYHSRIFHVANTMCAIFVNQPLDSSSFITPQIPKGAFELKISWKKASK
jgi:predicted O-methyltransferase YrrM